MNLSRKKTNKKVIMPLLGVAGVSLVSMLGISILSMDDNSLLTKNLNEDSPDLTPLSILVRDNANVVKPLVPSEYIGTNGSIVSSSGPIISWGDKITSIDWFGAERWSVDTSTFLPTGVNSSNWVSAWNRAFTNWAINKKTNVLYFTTNKKKNEFKQ